MNDQQQTLLILSIAISAIVGAVSGIVATMAIPLVHVDLNGVSPEAMTQQQVDSKIVELIEEESATIAVVERVAPSVVSVVIERPRGDVMHTRPSDPFNRFFFSTPNLSDEDASELIEVGGGTGFFVTSDGLIVTNKHVVNDEHAVFTVVTSDGEELSATLVASDPFQDIAILDVEGEGYPVANLGDSDGIQIGQTVIAIGNTLSEFRNTVTKGVISGINRRIVAGGSFGEEVIERAIQTDAAINPGNSGGPLINLRGDVVAVNTAVSFEGESLGFAIPINDIKRAVDDVREHGRIVRPWLGVRYVIISGELAEDQNLSQNRGALVVDGGQGVFAGSPADKAGIQEGDIILSIEGEAISEAQPLSTLISNHRPGDRVSMEIARGDEVLTLEVQLDEYQSDNLLEQ